MTEKERINACFRKAYDLYDMHKDTSPDELNELWQSFLEIAKNDMFLRDLMTSIWFEIRRRSMKWTSTTKQ